MSEEALLRTIVLLQDKIEELQSENIKLKHEIYLDPLTGLYNRRYLEKIDPEEVSGLILCDIDLFKMVNDTYGHTVGDIVLQKVSMTLKNALNMGKVIRYGGEEFLIVFEDTPVEMMCEIAEELRKSIEKLNLGFPLTMSFGVSEPKDNDIKQTISLADSALMECKRTGRNKVVFLNPKTMFCL